MAGDALEKLKDAERWANTSTPSADKPESPIRKDEASLAQPPKPPTLLFLSYSQSHNHEPPVELEYKLAGRKGELEEIAMHQGRSTSVQERFLADPYSKAELHRAEDEIKHLLQRKQREWGAVGDAPTVRVGLQCGDDHPQSVAFAEQIAKKDWDLWEFWDVDIQRGDLEEKVQVQKARRRGETRVLN